MSTPLDNSSSSYPEQNIDPRDKGYDWILQYCRAARNDSMGFMPYGFLNVGSLKMSEIKMYAMGKQPVDKYKKMMSPGNPTDPSWRAIDWTVPAFMCKYREIALAKMLQRKFDITAYAIDPLAKSEEDAYFNEMKVKMAMREMAQQAGMDISKMPALRPAPNEPQDEEQLMMEQDFGYKHIMAMEAENAVNLIFQQNNNEEIRKRTVESLFDFGLGAVTQWIDENGMVKEKSINTEYLGLSYCEKPDFSDLIHWFELVPTYVADLAPFYTKDQLDEICKIAIGKNGNPNQYTPITGMFNKSWNRFKVMVMHIKFLSYNETVFEETRDSKNNVRFGKSSYANKKFLAVDKEGKMAEVGDSEGYFAPMDETGEKGSATPKYMSSVKKVSYKASWVVDTNYMHDYGLRENQNRKLSSWWETDLDIQIYAWNFYRMQFTGVTERLIPLEDRACMAWFNLQNLSNKLIPYLINIDFNAVEAVNFGKGGAKSKPSEIIDFIFSNFVVPYRSTDLLSRNPNYKPVSIEATGQLAAFSQLYEELNHTIDMMRQVTGLNEITDGSTPDERNLNSTNAAAIQSTNNALYLISEADKYIQRATADAIVQKVQIAVGLGKVEGYAKALGSNMVKFFSINPRISLHELGIFIDDAPNDQQRQELWQEVNIKESQGLLTVADKIYIMGCRNLKEAAIVLAYRIKKKTEQQQQFQLQQTQVAAQSNAQVAQVTERMKQQTIQVQLQADLVRIQTEMEWQYRIEGMKKQADVSGEQLQADARTVGHQIQAQAKVEASKIAADAQVHGKHVDATTHIIGKGIDAEAAIEKQHVANKKPKAPAKT